ncbi:MAG: hypothetical protein R3D27_13590 [Hyphomicrobiaceae bacterium]
MPLKPVVLSVVATGLLWPAAAEAKSQHACKPPITGTGSDANRQIARKAAQADYLQKATAAYGKIAFNINVTRWCVPMRGGIWTCHVKANPCIDGGLPPSISRQPYVKPPRWRRTRDRGRTTSHGVLLPREKRVQFMPRLRQPARYGHRRLR